MKGNVFQCHGESASKQQFLKSVGVLEEHINKTFDYPGDIASVCKTFQITKIPIPANLSKADYEGDMAKRMIWEAHEAVREIGKQHSCHIRHRLGTV